MLIDHAPLTIPKGIQVNAVPGHRDFPLLLLPVKNNTRLEMLYKHKPPPHVLHTNFLFENTISMAMILKVRHFLKFANKNLRFLFSKCQMPKQFWSDGKAAKTKIIISLHFKGLSYFIHLVLLTCLHFK